VEFGILSSIRPNVLSKDRYGILWQIDRGFSLLQPSHYVGMSMRHVIRAVGYTGTVYRMTTLPNQFC